MIDIVIVNWNAGTLLLDCISSVRNFASDGIGRLIVVDNGSTDCSPDLTADLADVDLIRAGRNLGFAAACNLGAAKGLSPYILFLNPDCRLQPESLSVPLAFMERPENARAGICGIQLVDETGAVSRSCSRFPTLGRLAAAVFGLDKWPWFQGAGMQMREWNHADTRRTDQVMGAFFLIRREVFRDCNGFDERFFLYFEEVDLSYRAKEAGWDSWYLTDAQAYHAGGGTSRQVKDHRLFYSLRSRVLYGFKHFPLWQAWLLVGLTALVEPFTRTIFCLVSRDGAGLWNLLSAYRMLYRGMNRILRGEGRFQP